MEDTYLASSIEAIILASPEPISARKISGVLEDTSTSKISEAVAKLNERYAQTESSFRIRQIAGGFQYYVLPEYVGFVEELYARRRKLRLTRAALETVAIVAYRQPVTKGEIEHIRGVASDGVLHNLLEKGMITIVGRAETVGKPLQYGTTDEFLKFFGLNKVEDLPKMSEIEELVRASDAKHQTELVLEERSDGQVKFNIADGTYDPLTRVQDDDDDSVADSTTRREAADKAVRGVEADGAEDDDISTEKSLSDATDDTEAVPDEKAVDEDESTPAPNRLVLKHGSPKDTAAAGADEDEDDREELVEAEPGDADDDR